MRSSRRSSRVRRGMAALEVVFITAITVMLAVGIFMLLVLTLQRFFGMLGNSVGMPYL